MANEQRNFADMYPELFESMTRGAQWKRGMTPLSEKEMALSKERALTQEQRRWKEDQRRKRWLDFGPHGLGGEAGRDPSISSQAIEYLSMYPGNVFRRGIQRNLWEKAVPEKIRKRIKRHLKEMTETRVDPSTIPNFGNVAGRGVAVEDLEAYEQMSDKMGYPWPGERLSNQELKRKPLIVQDFGDKFRDPGDLSTDLGGRFLEYLREADFEESEEARDSLSGEELFSYLSQGRGDRERLEQSQAAREDRHKSMLDALTNLITTRPQGSKRLTPEQLAEERGAGASFQDLLRRTFGRWKTRDR